MNGTTRFDEPIQAGIIGPVTDSSIDELISSESVIVDGQERPGPNAETVLVFETPARQLALPRRVAAHLALIQEISKKPF
jgi:hypothetical protein